MSLTVTIAQVGIGAVSNAVESPALVASPTPPNQPSARLIQPSAFYGKTNHTQHE
jgi:hypothetical protein